MQSPPLTIYAAALDADATEPRARYSAAHFAAAAACIHVLRIMVRGHNDVITCRADEKPVYRVFYYNNTYNMYIVV